MAKQRTREEIAEEFGICSIMAVDNSYNAAKIETDRYFGRWIARHMTH